MLNQSFKKNINYIINRKDISYIKKAFTLIEVIIATLISMIVLSFIFLFLVNTIDTIWTAQNEVKIISSFYDFTNKINNLRNVYTTGWILIDSAIWSDVFLMKDSFLENGILIWPIRLSNNKLDIFSSIYDDKWVWFRKVSALELADINNDINIIYSYVFQKDQIFSKLKVQDFTLIEYNSWDIFDLSLTIDLNFQNSLVWQLWSSLPKNSLRMYNINF